MIKVGFYDDLYEPGNKLTYSVIAAKYLGNWVFIRHHRRNTFEIAGGHIESGETSLEAARRELMEETGAISFSLDCISTYSVRTGNETEFGRLYFAEIYQIGFIPDKPEIAEIVFLDHLPDMLTYPVIQTQLFNKVLEYLSHGKSV